MATELLFLFLENRRKPGVILALLTIVSKNILHYVENMGGGSSCTCNVRVCNYNKKGGYGLPPEGANINSSTQVNSLKDTLTNFMHPKNSPTDYFKTDVTATSAETVSQAALNDLRNTISRVTPIEGLTLDSFCINLTDSYNETTKSKTVQSKPSAEPFVSEGYTMIKPKSDCSAIICIIAAIIAFTFIGYFIYRYITCPCRKKHEKELREAELRR